MLQSNAVGKCEIGKFWLLTAVRRIESFHIHHNVIHKLIAAMLCFRCRTFGQFHWNLYEEKGLMEGQFVLMLPLSLLTFWSCSFHRYSWKQSAARRQLWMLAYRLPVFKTHILRDHTFVSLLHIPTQTIPIVPYYVVDIFVDFIMWVPSLADFARSQIIHPKCWMTLYHLKKRNSFGVLSSHDVASPFWKIQFFTLLGIIIESIYSSSHFSNCKLGANLGSFTGTPQEGNVHHINVFSSIMKYNKRKNRRNVPD